MHAGKEILRKGALFIVGPRPYGKPAVPACLYGFRTVLQVHRIIGRIEDIGLRIERKQRLLGSFFLFDFLKGVGSLHAGKR